MTTAHKPTWHPAVGGGAQGGWRYHAPRMQFSSRDMAGETKLKTRQLGQNAPDEVEVRDLKKELLAREAQHFKKVHEEKVRKGLIADQGPEPSKMMKSIDFSKFDDDDDTDSDDSEDDESEEEDDEEAELMKELERIKKEREEEKKRKEAEEAAEEYEMQNEEIMSGNPLLNESTFSVKRRWDEDVVFKNQSRGEKKVVKRFINDTIRSDFHRNFMKKYIQ